MIRTRPLLVLYLLITIPHLQGNTDPGQGRYQPFNGGWRFHEGHVLNADKAAFDDSTWRVVDLPHDWSIEDIPGRSSDPGIIGPFDSTGKGGTSAGWTRGGIGWYRKAWVAGPAASGKRVILHFDGVYQESNVYVNGFNLGRQNNGYFPFYYDITPYLLPVGERNTIAVRVDHELESSRWYAGSGIYRSVWLHIVDPTHVDVWGVDVRTPVASQSGASMEVSVVVRRDSETPDLVEANLQVFDPKGVLLKEKRRQIKLDKVQFQEFKEQFELLKPSLWSPDSPALYTLKIQLIRNGVSIDSTDQSFGVRSLEFSPEQGFVLNESPVLLKGGCVHHDNGILGAAAHPDAETRRIRLLKDRGFNAVRTAHNPPSQAFLDACDRLGMLVIDESFDQWQWFKKDNDNARHFNENWKKDLTSMVLRDRNHPSIILWSVGNEIPERMLPAGKLMGRQLVDLVHQIDPTRPVTMAYCNHWDHPDIPWEASAEVFALFDVAGYNYGDERMLEDLPSHPKRIMVSTESNPRDAQKMWKLVEQYPQIIGDFVWTAMDHLGESGIGHNAVQAEDPGWEFCRPWPWFNANCGDIDLIGNQKPQSKYRDVIWGISPLELAVHRPIPDGLRDFPSQWGYPDELASWTWPGHEGKPVEVTVYSRCERVTLFLNGAPLEEKQVSRESDYIARFSVPYQPGILEAVGWVGDQEAIRKRLETTGKAARIVLKPEATSLPASRDRLVYVPISVVDSEDRTLPEGEFGIHLAVEGPAQLLAFGSASPNHPESFQDGFATTFRGRAIAILRLTHQAGQVSLIALANGLTPARAEINLTVVPPPQKD